MRGESGAAETTRLPAGAGSRRPASAWRGFGAVKFARPLRNSAEPELARLVNVRFAKPMLDSPKCRPLSVLTSRPPSVEAKKFSPVDEAIEGDRLNRMGADFSPGNPVVGATWVRPSVVPANSVSECARIQSDEIRSESSVRVLKSIPVAGPIAGSA